MIIRRHPSALHLITQPDHAALAVRIMREWSSAHFPETARKPSILHAIEEHDCGWAEFDEALVLDAETGELLDFTEVPTAVKRESSSRGIPPLASDPYAAALAAQHRLHVYRRYVGDPEWTRFFEEMTSERDSFLGSSAGASLAELTRDYRFVRAGDLASLAFCNEWEDTQDDGCGYSMHFDGKTLTITPDPFDGRRIPIEIEARVIDNGRFGTPTAARDAVTGAPSVKLSGTARGSPLIP